MVPPLHCALLLVLLQVLLAAQLTEAGAVHDQQPLQHPGSEGKTVMLRPVDGGPSSKGSLSYKEIARDIAKDTARNSARDTAWDTAWAAWDTARDTARNSAGDAAWDTAWAAWDTAQDTAQYNPNAADDVYPVCGTDGVNYPSRNALQRSASARRGVSVRHYGPCEGINSGASGDLHSRATVRVCKKHCEKLALKCCGKSTSSDRLSGCSSACLSLMDGCVENCGHESSGSSSPHAACHALLLLLAATANRLSA